MEDCFIEPTLKVQWKMHRKHIFMPLVFKYSANCWSWSGCRCEGRAATLHWRAGGRGGDAIGDQGYTCLLKGSRMTFCPFFKFPCYHHLLLRGFLFSNEEVCRVIKGTVPPNICIPKSSYNVYVQLSDPEAIDQPEMVKWWTWRSCNEILLHAYNGLKLLYFYDEYQTPPQKLLLLDLIC